MKHQEVVWDLEVSDRTRAGVVETGGPGVCLPPLLSSLESHLAAEEEEGVASWERRGSLGRGR